MKIEEQVEDLLSVFTLENAITYCHSRVVYHRNHGTKQGVIHWSKVVLELLDIKNGTRKFPNKTDKTHEQKEE